MLWIPLLGKAIPRNTRRESMQLELYDSYLILLIFGICYSIAVFP